MKIRTPNHGDVARAAAHKGLELTPADIDGALLLSTRFAAFEALSLPCGVSAGLPVGLGLLGRHFDKPGLLRVASAYEQRRG